MTIQRIVLVAPPSADGTESPQAQRAASWCARLRAGGLDAVVATSAEDVAAAASGFPCSSVLVVPLSTAADDNTSNPIVPSPAIAWRSLAPSGTSLKDDCAPIIRAVVQHNYEASFAVAAAAPATDAASPPPLVVGYAMRESRERALAEAGLLYFVPRASGSGRAVVFMPLGDDDDWCGDDEEEQDEDADAGGSPFLPSIVDVVLHKASDYLTGAPDRDNSSIEDTFSFFSRPLRRLLRHAVTANARRAVAVVDPLEAVARCVLDRRDIAALLSRAFGDDEDPEQQPPLPVRVRGPRQLFLAEPPADARALADALAAAGLDRPPYIVKTAAACGVPHAHRMAVALSDEGLWEALAGARAGALPSQQQRPLAPTQPLLLPPFPLVVQEFVDHGAVQHKVYVLGDELVYAAPPHPSIPDLAEAVEALRRMRGGGAEKAAAPSPPPPPPPQLLTFDALKSLPTSLPWNGGQAGASTTAPGAAPLDQAALGAVARRLRWATRANGGGSDDNQQGLSLFGFDAIVASPQEWVVVDVNYLPNYRGGGERAAAALREVLTKAAAAAAAAAVAGAGAADEAAPAGRRGGEE